jgi:hypothetical protein
MASDNPALKWTAGGLLVAAAIAAGVYLARPQTPIQAPPAASAPTAAPVEPVIEHPIEQARVEPDAVPVEPLPELMDSDPVAMAALGGIAGLPDILLPEHVIERIVATVDNLPRKRLAPRVLPSKPAEGTLATSPPPRVTLAPENYARYDRYVRAFTAADTETLVAGYVRLYPLFQKAYRELGYPDAYFNDRLVEVIDHLLAAPEIAEPVELVRPRAFWEFADPGLESLSAGHKVLIRIGPGHAARVKARLRELRAALVGAELRVPDPAEAGNPADNP